MNRRSFFQKLAGVAAALAATPLLKKLELPVRHAAVDVGCAKDVSVISGWKINPAWQWSEYEIAFICNGQVLESRNGRFNFNQDAARFNRDADGMLESVPRYIRAG